VDFDVTECGRFVGLGFLSAGRYFLINNGSYAKDFDTPERIGIDPWMNMYFYPGPARARVCRQAAQYDVILPAHLMLTHYLPDGPRTSQENNLASLVLGGNGLWGDLLDLNEADIRFWAESLADYKRIWQAAGRAYPRVSGAVGFSPEVHEKIDPQSASGVVAIFTRQAQRVDYLTQPLDPARLEGIKGADTWEILPDGRVKLTVNLGQDGARTVFFFGQQSE
jgi:alpha-galactosidase